MLKHKQNLFSFDSFLLFLLKEFAEVLEGKSDAFNLVYLRVAESTHFLLSGCFQLSTNLDRDFFRYLLFNNFIKAIKGYQHYVCFFNIMKFKTTKMK